MGHYLARSLIRWRTMGSSTCREMGLSQMKRWHRPDFCDKNGSLEVHSALQLATVLGYSVSCDRIWHVPRLATNFGSRITQKGCPSRNDQSTRACLQQWIISLSRGQSNASRMMTHIISGLSTCPMQYLSSTNTGQPPHSQRSLRSGKKVFQLHMTFHT